MKIPDLVHHDLTDTNHSFILLTLTGQAYTFANASSMRWGANGRIEEMDTTTFPDGFWQIMPHTVDDGFFDWYCYHREEQQFLPQRKLAPCILFITGYNGISRESQSRFKRKAQAVQTDLGFS